MPVVRSTLPLLLASLCFVAFPIGLGPLMKVEEPQRLALAALAAGCWMGVVWLGFTSISAGAGSDLERSGEFTRRTVFQLLLFLLGAVLMASAILIASRA